MPHLHVPSESEQSRIEDYALASKKVIRGLSMPMAMECQDGERYLAVRGYIVTLVQELAVMLSAAADLPNVNLHRLGGKIGDACNQLLETEIDRTIAEKN